MKKLLISLLLALTLMLSLISCDSCDKKKDPADNGNDDTTTDIPGSGNIDGVEFPWIDLPAQN